MNWDLKVLLTMAITWTMIGTILLPLAECLNPRLIKNAACRHRTWGLVFGGLFLVPIFQLVDAAVAACHPPFSSISPLLGGTWILGTLFVLGRFALACMRLQALRRQSSPFHSEAVDIPSLRHRGGVFETLEIRISLTQEPPVPITWGCWKLVVLLPKSANEWPGTRLAAVLLHEFGHVGRRDHLMQTLALLVCAIHWFNPFFWRAARKMEVDGEIAADDCAILAGLRPSSYAAELLYFATQLTPQRRSRTRIETAMAKESTVENRLRAILEPASVRGPIGFWHAAMVNALVLLLFISAELSMKSLPVGGPTSQGPATCRPR